MKQSDAPTNARDKESISIETGCRLHLGLMEICPSEPNVFGGIGVMAAQPATRIEGLIGPVAHANDVEILADTYWSRRIAILLERWCSIRNNSELPIRKLILSQSAPPHCGLGSGTQVACAVISLLEQASGRTISSTEELRNLTGRGVRSCVGLQGFMEGGLIVDYGGTEKTPRNSRRLSFPTEWQLLLVRVSSTLGDSGDAEQQMFNRCASIANPNRERMLDLIESEIVPAVQSHDWIRWDAAIGQYGFYAGQIFSLGQGGVYRTPAIGALVDECAQLGCFGAAQSSWGPTVLMVAKDSDHANWLTVSIKKRFDDAHVISTSPRNCAASLF